MVEYILIIPILKRMEVTKLIIDIFGAGAIGLLFYSKLISNSAVEAIHLWTRTAEQASIINQQGITFQTSTTDCSVEPQTQIPSVSQLAYATDEINSQNKPTADYILITVKQKDLTANLISYINKRSDKHTRIICLQNGVRTDTLWDFPWQVYAGITTEGAKRISTNEVSHTGIGKTIIGSLTNLSSTRVGNVSKSIAKEEQILIQPLLNELQQAGFDITLSNNIEKEIYRKLIINAVINPLTSIWRIRNGELLLSNQRITIMRQLYDEVMEVYQAVGIEVSSLWWEEILQVCHATANNTSSMLADVLQGTITEIQWINGSIIKMGEDQHISTPANYWVYHLVEAMNRQEDN